MYRILGGPNSDPPLGNYSKLFNYYMPKIMFQKKNSKHEILNHLYFGPKFKVQSFFGTSLGRFSQCFFFYFLLSASLGGRHFYSALTTIKKLPTALNTYWVKITSKPTKYHIKRCWLSTLIIQFFEKVTMLLKIL